MAPPSARLRHRLAGTVMFVGGADATERARRLADEIGTLGTVSPPATPEALERLVADLRIPDGPLTGFVFMRAQASDAAEVRVSYRCRPESRYVALREDIHRDQLPALRRLHPGRACHRPRGPRDGRLNSLNASGAGQTTSIDIESVIPLDTYRYWT
ncbi:hypothetical protein ACIHFD_59515 [Nonomuraea sp. NPDC051941]|uniref:hypothetical protein n=1 Tax=Nonomuraea sp. NPDC051941 TaxID=3364373 RepID=UPI0037CC6AE0